MATSTRTRWRSITEITSYSSHSDIASASATETTTFSKSGDLKMNGSRWYLSLSTESKAFIHCWMAVPRSPCKSATFAILARASTNSSNDAPRSIATSNSKEPGPSDDCTEAGSITVASVLAPLEFVFVKSLLRCESLPKRPLIVSTRCCCFRVTIWQ